LLTVPQLVVKMRQVLTTPIYNGGSNSRGCGIAGSNDLYNEFLVLLPSEYLEVFANTLPGAK
jgi:hypothetical protein